MVAIFLEHSNAAGSQAFIEIAIQGDCSTFFLPDDPSQEKITLSSHADDGHTYLCLEVHHKFALLRTFNVSCGPCSILGDDHRDVQLPESTVTHHKSIILRPTDHFLAPSGRWAVHWDEDGKISESMKPPCLPIVSDTSEAEEANTGVLEGFLDVGKGSPSKSSGVTCSPTPSAAGEEEDEGSPIESREDHKEYAKEPAVSETPLDNTGTLGRLEDKHPGNPKPEGKPKFSSEPASTSDSAHPVSPRSIPGSKDMAIALTTDGTATDSVYRADSSSAVDAIQTPSNSQDSADEPRTESDANGILASGETRGRKRKLKYMEVTDTGLHSSDTETDASKGVEVADTIIVSRKSNRSNATKDKTKAIKTPAKQTRSRRSPILPDERPDSNISQKSSGRPGMRRGRSSRAWYAGPAPVVLFSGSTTIQDDRAVMSAFGRLGGKVGMTINNATVLCIPEGHVKKTGKLIMAVAKGIDIVTEKWITYSQRLGRFPGVAHYLPRDETQERAWGCNLRAAIQGGKEGLTHLLSGTTVYLTKELRHSLGNLERETSQIAWILGAEAVKRRLPALKDKDTLSQTSVLVIGVRDDPQGAHVGRLGQVLFNKDILTMAALRGRLERNSEEFVIEMPIKDEEEL
ncbi:hypothetical protein G647_08175 [Cladophialophora carrionii CBS 160.54]|uniref:BRCT domain-containing protein n=1 Tax=Cladophialophora carrionii CBS 160.54 TaxID=1279043 RepID=V9D0E7_9EURO|nr:uncharacterized protein G647_08175 [Cladophialophora carrionii CBS 160.54]ETI20141.1 hypothetical protein G647_08175 [Cladophialophora carrionii CBS 160.54]